MSEQDFRQLYDELLNYEGGSPYTDVLLPWLEEGGEVLAWLASFRQRQGSPIPPASHDELSLLYSLGRVCDTLILRFQEGGAEHGWEGPDIAIDEFTAFMEALGLTVSKPANFCAFYHEVVKVVPIETGEPRITAYRWPCVMLGNMLVLRAGVELAALSDSVRPGIADQSKLYWTYRRKSRPTQDLSHGWGHNSQWSTAFRRDYHIGALKYFNVDGKWDMAQQAVVPAKAIEAGGELTVEERIELLTHRCFVTCTKADEDLWPYDDRCQS